MQFESDWVIRRRAVLTAAHECSEPSATRDQRQRQCGGVSGGKPTARKARSMQTPARPRRRRNLAPDGSLRNRQRQHDADDNRRGVGKERNTEKFQEKDRLHERSVASPLVPLV